MRSVFTKQFRTLRSLSPRVLFLALDHQNLSGRDWTRIAEGRQRQSAELLERALLTPPRIPVKDKPAIKANAPPNRRHVTNEKSLQCDATPPTWRRPILDQK